MQCVFILTHLNFCVSEPNLAFFVFVGNNAISVLYGINSCFLLGLKKFSNTNISENSL